MRAEKRADDKEDVPRDNAEVDNDDKEEEKVRDNLTSSIKNAGHKCKVPYTRLI